MGDAQVRKDGLGEAGGEPTQLTGQWEVECPCGVGCGLGSQEGEGASEGLQEGAMGHLLQSSPGAWLPCHTWEVPTCTMERGALH